MVPLVSVSSIWNSIIASVKIKNLLPLGRYSAGDRATSCRAPAAGTSAYFETLCFETLYSETLEIPQEPVLHPREDLAHRT
jgi:hypothetical protein